MKIDGERYVVLPQATFDRMVERLGDVKLPDLPEANERGRRPARATGRVVLARKLIERRVAAGWTQQELADQAGVRVETVRWLEEDSGRPRSTTIAKLDEVFRPLGL